MEYYLNENGSVTLIDEDKSTSIPPDENNWRYKDYLKWVAEGNIAKSWEPNQE